MPIPIRTDIDPKKSDNPECYKKSLEIGQTTYTNVCNVGERAVSVKWGGLEWISLIIGLIVVTIIILKMIRTLNSNPNRSKV